MSLNKTLDRLFDEIRREAKRNPEFADRLDAVLRLHDSRRDVPDEVVEEIATPAPAAPSKPAAKGKPAVKAEPPVAEVVLPPPAPAAKDEGAVDAPELNPVGVYQRDGEAALVAALEDLGLPALQAMIAEHNLDPSGATADFDRDGLCAHVLAQAKRRSERDAKMFDY
jgi:hypothetical protein